MLEFVVETARRAGALLLAGLDGDPVVELKSPYEVVTAIDRASEELIVGALSRQFPDHAILAEEGGGFERDSEYRWVIDPLDGTNNYAHRYPCFCVSIALVRGDQSILGVIYDPLRDELFTGQAGEGAWCNGRRLRVAATPTLASALVSTGFPYDYGANPANNRVQFDRIQASCQGVRRGGSAALDLAYVAAGRLDAHWELRLKPWDSAAAAIMVTEAGGTITDWRGGAWSPWSEDMIASNGRIHAELIAHM
jgi:myo-inositol-1(or 4)-monophosphatase